MWIADIPAVDLASYQRLTDRWFAHFASSEGVLAFGSFGSVGAPGLSDLDLAVVVADEALARGALRLLPLDADEAQLMIHPPLVIPASLFADLPLYHPVSIRWQQGGEAYPEQSVDPIIGRLHVIEKTLYVQGRLLRAGVVDRSLRRLFLMLTSLARSVEWTERSGVAPTAGEAAYATEILQLRDDWLAEPDARPALESRLDGLLRRARPLALTLSERLAASLMTPAAAGAGGDAVLQLRPLQFVQRLAGDPAAAVGGMPTPRPGWRGRLDGECRLAGPEVFRLLLARCAVQRRFGTIAWPLLCPDGMLEDALNGAPEPTRAALEQYGRANAAYARILAGAGLTAADFGISWSAAGRRRLAYLALAHGAPLVSRYARA